MELTLEEGKLVLIAGIGPRTGTTLVQRIINSHPDAWIWGEPGKTVEAKLTKVWKDMNFSRAALYERDKAIYEALKASTNGLEFAWTASIMPSEDRMWQAWRAFFEVGFRTKRIWGFKSVTCKHLAFMRYLFPGAYIIVTVRSPLAQYKSYRTGINGIEPPKQTIKRLWNYYLDYLQIPKEDELLLVLDNFEPEKWVDEIFRCLNEPVPPNAVKTAKTKVRGPVPPPLDKVSPKVERLIHAKLDPLYQEVLARRRI